MSSFAGGQEGTYTIRRRITNVPNGAWTLLNFRQADWFGACPQLTTAQKTRALIVGEARVVNFRLYSSTAGDEIKIAEEQVPGDRFNSVDLNVRTMVMRFANYRAASQLWWESVNGSEDVELEVTFDIPADADL